MTALLRLAAAFFAVLGLAAIDGSAIAQPKDKEREKAVKQHKHHNGKDLLGERKSKDGEHKLHENGKHTAFVSVSKGKITGMRVRHADKGNVAVKKYKTSKKMAGASFGGMQPVSLLLAQVQDLGTVWIGYSYIDDYGNEVIYWFPYDLIYDGDTGAVEYIPLA